MTEDKKVVKLPDPRDKQVQELAERVNQRAQQLLAQDPMAQRLAGKIELLTEQINSDRDDV